jgi:two-component system, OmpR family, alkaline phosphatase synthesis response regulator PhoP
VLDFIRTIMDKILLVDDEKDILEFLNYNLRKEGYEVYTARNGKYAIALAQQIIPQLSVLDVMMPGMDGIETCRELRQIDDLKNIMIVFLSARNEDYSQIAGLEAGADDYIAKPIKPRVFITKIKALLRRTTKDTDQGTAIKIGNLIIDAEKYIVIKDNDEIDLPKKEFELLQLLAGKPNKVFSRDEIFAKIWGNSVVVGDRTIDVHIRKLREKIGDDFIKTIKGVGYKLEI